jgi:hypothetical protein
MQTQPDAPAEPSRWPHDLRRASVRALIALRAVGRASVAVLLELWRAARPLLIAGLQFLLALVIVFEEWGWRPLADLLARGARWKPVAQLETAIARLPPYAALVVFVLPSTLLLPLKFLALFLVARGQVILAGILFMAAKVVATALIARLFILTQPALMQIGWFAWGYERLMPWKEALVRRVHESWAWRVGRLWKERLKRPVGAEWRRWRPSLLAWRERLAASSAEIVVRARRLARETRARWMPHH